MHRWQIVSALASIVALAGFSSISVPGSMHRGGGVHIGGPKERPPWVRTIVDERGLYAWGSVNEDDSPGIPEELGADGHYLSMHAANHLLTFAEDNGYDRVVVTNNFFRGAPNSPEWKQDTDDFVALAHNTYGLLVEGLATSQTRVDEMALRDYDALRIDLESFPWGESEITTEPYDAEDIQIYADMKAAAGDKPLYVFIGWHWSELITYGGVEKEAYKHIIDITDGADCSPGWGRDLANNGDETIIARCDDIIGYSWQKRKPVWITLTSKPNADPNQTFYDEGETDTHAVGNVLLNLEGEANFEPSGILYHYWLTSWGSDGTGWPNDGNYSASWPEEVDLTFRLSPDESIKKNLFGQLLDFEFDGTELDKLYFYDSGFYSGATLYDNSDAFGDDMNLAGSGTAPDFGEPSPLYDRTSIKFNGGQVLETSSDFGDLIATRDFAIEFVVKLSSSSDQQGIFAKYDGTTHHYFCYQVGDPPSVICQVGNIGLIKCLDGDGEFDTWYHFLWYGDADYQSQCYANGVASGGVVGIGAAASPGNAEPFVIGGLDNSTQLFSGTVAYVAAWQCPLEDKTCLDTATTDNDSNSIYDWRDYAKQRLLKLNQLWPSTDSVGVWHGTSHRQSSAYTSMQASSGATRTLFRVGTGWPRLEQFTYDSESHLAYISEPDNQNSVLYSEQFDNGWAVGTSVSVTANQAVAPDGETTADLITAAGTTAQYIGRGVTGPASNVNSAHSIFVKPVNVDWMYVYSNDGSAAGCYFDLVTPAVGTCSANTWGYIEDWGDGWVRPCFVDATNGTAGTTYSTYYYAADGDGDTEFSEAPGNAFYLFGAQTEVWMERCGSYMPTTSAAVAKAFDVSFFESTSDFFDSDGAIYTKFVGPDVDDYLLKDSNDARMLYRFTGSSDYIYLTTNTSESLISRHDDWNISGTTDTSDGKLHKHRVKFETNSAASLIDGVSQGTDSTVSVAAGVNQFYFGGRETEGDQCNMHITDVQIFSTNTSEVH